MRKLKIGLALGAGGARGISHLAFLQAMEELGVKPDIISGSSIGALIGAYYSAGLSYKEIYHILLNIDLKDMAKFFDFSLFDSSGFVKGKGVEEFIKDTLPVHDFESLSIPLKIVATDYWKREEVIFENGDLVKPIRASISIPVLFEAVPHNDTILVDGVITNPVPYDILKDDCDLLIAIDVTGLNTPPSTMAIPNRIEIMINTIQIMQASIIRSKGIEADVAIFAQPELKNIGVFDFHKHKEIWEGTKLHVERFKKDLKHKLKL